ncbi:membrane-bound protease [Gloeomargarita lithophora Alchichica-D10]|uniref:Membrane-bound protease n=1 Tax=Gloeomargarita lithophora Alchichica-D10 TaxID=1188229 RepID=A0A1J0A8Y7_9CYAN|nr:DUF3488 and transglutaminase-like domain-containing protein [Gloeomargarita lithophora]APB32383.1 membrane-bound protease [Gloeomargarita lithophora Alchichica-D10]
MTWNLTTTHKTCTYALVGIALAALVIANATNLFVNGLFLVLGLVSWFWEPPRIRWEQVAPLWMPLTVGVLVLLVLGTVALKANPLDASLYLLLYLTLAKLFQRERPEDYNQATALSFLVLAATTVYTSDILFGLLFALYVILGVMNFTLYHLRVQVRSHPKAAGQSRLFGPRVMMALFWVAVVTFLMSVGLFFLFPRVGLGFFGRGAGQQEASQGFNDQVNVGDHGRLNQDTRVVMRVEFPEGRPPQIMPLYWRGVSFDRYDGTAWLRTQMDGQLKSAQDQVVELRSPPEGTALIRQDIYLEPSPHLVLFALNPAYRVKLPETVQGLRVQVGNLGEPQDRARIIRQWGRSVYQTRTGDVYYNYGGDVGYQYSAWSRPIFPSANDLRRVDWNLTRQRVQQQWPNEVYLQLPPDFNPKIRELTEEITRTAPTEFDQVQAIQDYLTQNFTYTTDLPNPGDEPPLDAFLFTHQRGHCEYFATAMTVMLRSIGIPARLVNGYLGGRWNQYDQYLAVQAANAHSWVEVPFAGYNWVTFDPTPAGALPQIGGWWSDLADALRFRWNKYVLEYNLDTQMEGVKSVQSWLTPPANRQVQSSDWQTWWRQNGLRVGVVILLTGASGVWGYGHRGRVFRGRDGLGLVLLVGGTGWVAQPLLETWGTALGGGAPALAYVLARYLRWGQAQASVPAISRLYLQLRDELAQQGLPITPEMGPMAVLLMVRASDLPARDVAAQVLETYMNVRFGGQSLSRSEFRSYQQQVQYLLQQWQSRQKQKVTH